MPVCRDPAISQLSSLGYDVVRFPREDIRPLDLIIEHGSEFSRYGYLPNSWHSKTSPPDAKPLAPGANIKSVTTSELRGRFGLQALVELLGRISFTLSGNKQCSVQLSAEDSVITSCSFDLVAQYIRDGEVDSDSATADALFDDSNRAWLIFEVVASNKLRITVGQMSEAEAKIAAEEISKTLAATAEASHVTSTGNTVTYERTLPLVFGFKSAELTYEGRWKLDPPARAGKKFLGPGQLAASSIAPGRRLTLLNV